MKLRIDFIVMAAGSSRRFGKNKLLQKIHGRSMFLFILDELEQAVKKLDHFSCRIFVVTQYKEIGQEVKRRQEASVSEKAALWQPAVYSPESVQGVSFTIKNGLRAAGTSDYYMFLTADQPCMQAGSIVRLVLETWKSGKGIGSMCWEDKPGNPVLFHSSYVPQLMSLEEDAGGRRIVKKNLSDCYYCQVQRKEELLDADTAEALNIILDYLS